MIFRVRADEALDTVVRTGYFGSHNFRSWEFTSNSSGGRSSRGMEEGKRFNFVGFLLIIKNNKINTRN